MIDPELVAKIRLLFFAEHWKIGTIATQLNLHRDTVRTALETDRFNRPKQDRTARKTSPYVDFIRQTLAQYPRLRSTRILQMIRARGYEGGSSQLRRFVAQLRLVVQEPFLQLRTFPGEQGQADWAHFGEVHIGQARRQLSCFVITLSYTRALASNFFFDQRLESLLCAHVEAFAQFQGAPRAILYDNMRSVVLARHENQIRFHPRVLELAAHYHFAPQPCRPARGNEKGRVERVIRYIRESFFAARPFTTLEDFNRQAYLWRDEVAHQRPWPQDDSRTVAQVFAQERPRLLPLPAHTLETDCMLSVHAGKTIYLRFDLNDYSIPPTAMGRALILLASPSTIRILQDGIEIARHRRSWDRHQIIEEPAHRQALLEEAFRRGESLGPASQQLLQLLDDYGAEELRQAIRVALDRATPRLSSVAYILQQRRRRQQLRVLRPVHLQHRPDLADLHVQPHDSDTYDVLSHNAEEDDEPRD